MKYNTEIEQLKQANRDAKSRYEAALEEHEDITGSILYDLYGAGSDITYDDLNGTPVGEDLDMPVILGGHIYSQRIDNKEDEITFNVFFSIGATLPKHCHSDSIEEVHIVEDDIVSVLLTEGASVKKRILKRGDSLVINPNIFHQFTSHKGKMMKVTFHKVK